MVLHGYIHTFDADIKMFSSHPLYTNISGNIFCACFPQKLSLTLGLGCPAHLSRRWSPAPLSWEGPRLRSSSAHWARKSAKSLAEVEVEVDADMVEEKLEEEAEEEDEEEDNSSDKI